MTQADRVHSTPPLNTSAINPTAGLDWLDVRVDASPQEIFRAIGRLRKEARDEIERLIGFLDASDPYVATELEADYAEYEPMLGSHEISPAGAVCYLPSELRCEFDLEGDQCEDEGVTV